MRARALAFIALSFLVAAPAAVAEEPSSPPRTEPPAPKLETVHLEVTVEEAKAPAVEKALAAVPGVTSFAWFAPATEAKVVRTEGTASDAALVEAAKAAGATAAARIPLTTTKLVFAKKLHCGGCAAQVDKTLRARKGVKDVVVLSDKTGVSVVHDARAVTAADMEALMAEIKKPATAEKQ
jgi:copper chaperone CopZ